MEEIAVKCKGLKKTFSLDSIQVNALQGIDLEVKKGELMMLVGPSGSGKTTLISIMAGVLKQTEGECLVFGKDINNLKEEEKITYRGANIGFLFQAFNLIHTLTCQENIAIPLILNGIDKKQAMAEAKEILTKVDLEERERNFPLQLSGGQQQRVAIARSLIHKPKLIVCDEPTSFLDHENGRKVLQILKNIVVAEKLTLVVVTHDVRIFEFADRIAHIEDGKITTITAPHQDHPFFG